MTFRETLRQAHVAAAKTYLLWTWLWVALVAAIALDEFAAIARHKPATEPTLTQTMVGHVPWWITVPFTAWLVTHFALAYHDGGVPWPRLVVALAFFAAGAVVWFRIR